jgi:hypothetical protein
MWWLFGGENQKKSTEVIHEWVAGFPPNNHNPWPEGTGMLIAHRLSIVKRRSSSISAETEVSRR